VRVPPILVVLLGASVLVGWLLLRNAGEIADSAVEDRSLSPAFEDVSAADSIRVEASRPAGTTEADSDSRGDRRTAVAAPRPVSLRGRLVDDAGKPLPNRTFRWRLEGGAQRIRTQADGAFHSEPLLCSGSGGSLEATWPVEHGVNVFRAELALPAFLEGERDLGEVTLKPMHTGVAGQVFDPRGIPVARATVSGGGASVHTDDFGRFELVSPRERFALRARAQDVGSSNRVFVEEGETGLALVLGERSNPLVRLHAADRGLLEQVHLEAAEVPSGRALTLERGGPGRRGEWFMPRARGDEVELRFRHAIAGELLWSRRVPVETAGLEGGVLSGGQTLEVILEECAAIAVLALTCGCEGPESAAALAPGERRAAALLEEGWRWVPLDGSTWRTVVPRGGALTVELHPGGPDIDGESWPSRAVELVEGFQACELYATTRTELLVRTDPLSTEPEVAAGGRRLELWLCAAGDARSSVPRRGFATRLPAGVGADGRLLLDVPIPVCVPGPGSYVLEARYIHAPEELVVGAEAGGSARGAALGATVLHRAECEIRAGGASIVSEWAD
jgi:hypothetical protein